MLNANFCGFGADTSVVTGFFFEAVLQDVNEKAAMQMIANILVNFMINSDYLIMLQIYQLIGLYQ
jgi:hypothetical protein